MNAKVITNFQLGSRESSSAPDVLPLAKEHALQSAGAAFHALADTMPQMVWSTLPDGSHDYYNARWYEFTGVPVGSTDGEGWAGMFHEDDQADSWKKWNHSLATGEPYEVEYRLRHHSGDYRWMIGRALPILNEQGDIQRWIGTCTDIDEQKRTALQNEILSQELSHRIKNIFAVVTGLISVSARQFPEAKAFASSLRDRLQALAKAHDYARPHREELAFERSTVLPLLERLLEPYGLDRVRLEGDDAQVDDAGATPLALLIHELATNAAKYGALSIPEGRVEVTTRREGDALRITWLETDGPAVRPPEKQGFGTRLAEMSVRNQLGGKLARTWAGNGLSVVIEVPVGRLVRAVS